MNGYKYNLRRDIIWKCLPAYTSSDFKSGGLYIGATTDLNQRYKDHCSGKASQTTKLDPPVALLYSEGFETFSEARKRETQIKRWSRSKKEALVAGDLSRLRELSRCRKKS